MGTKENCDLARFNFFPNFVRGTDSLSKRGTGKIQVWTINIRESERTRSSLPASSLSLQFQRTRSSIPATADVQGARRTNWISRAYFTFTFVNGRTDTRHLEGERGNARTLLHSLWTEAGHYLLSRWDSSTFRSNYTSLGRVSNSNGSPNFFARHITNEREREREAKNFTHSGASCEFLTNSLQIIRKQINEIFAPLVSWLSIESRTIAIMKSVPCDWFQQPTWISHSSHRDIASKHNA